MKTIYVVLLLLCFSLSGFAQSASVDSVSKSGTIYNFQQTESVNVFYDDVNDKFTIENNTKQIHNFYFGIFNLTGSPVLEVKKECLTGKSVDISVNLTSGLYIVNVVDKPISFTKKFIIH